MKKNNILKYIFRKIFIFNNIFICKYIFTFLLLILFLAFPKNIFAGNDFYIDTINKYYFSGDGKTKIIDEITIENILPTIYAKNYTITFQGINPQNINVYDQYNNLYIHNVTNENDTISVNIDFPDDLIGKGASRIFFIEYESDLFVKRYGEIYEIYIPKLSNPDDYRRYDTELFVPQGFGKKSYISPNPIKESYENNNNIYYYNKELLKRAGINAAFGDFQVFDFTIYYHLENPLSKLGATEIALPPDTSFQKIYYSEISPKPIDIKKDIDGNWIANYILNPKQNLEIVAKGSVKIFSKGVKTEDVDQEYLLKNTLPTDLWQSDNSEIKYLALKLKTPKNIYDYVVNNLKYNYQKVYENTNRMGALSVLRNPDNVICTDFTDLFIALSRAAGIPAREINGFSYADNPKVQPQSLIADVLHSWPEYWDSDQNIWKPVDPTWGNTTGGEDYFNKLDLRHFTFVIHGIDSEKPYPPGSYKTSDNNKKDIFVSFGKLPNTEKSSISYEILDNGSFYIPWNKIEIKVINNNGYSVENENLKIYFDEKEIYNINIPLILPYSSSKIYFDNPSSIFGKDTPKEIKLSYLGNHFVINGIKSKVIIINLVILFLFILFLIILYFLISKKHVIKNKLKAVYGNINKFK